MCTGKKLREWCPGSYVLKALVGIKGEEGDETVNVSMRRDRKAAANEISVLVLSCVWAHEQSLPEQEE